MNVKKHYTKSFWKSLPNSSYYKLLIALFFLFSTLGFITNLFGGAKQTFWFLTVNVVLSGILGVLYAHGAVRNWKIFPIIISLHLFLVYLLASSNLNLSTNSNQNIETQLIVTGVGLIISITMAYVFFIIFITGEGIPQLRMKAEMDLAKQMHDVIVPDINYKSENFDIYGKSFPISEVGGDLIDVYLKDDSLLCYIADVSGHGVSAGLLMGMFKSSIHTTMQNENNLESIINFSNKALIPLKKQNMFLTTSLIQFNPNGYAEYLVAGHLPIIHYKSDQNTIEELHTKQIPISVKSDFKFVSEIASYKSGDLFILLSDGITEVFNKKNNEFGISRVKSIIMENVHLSISELLNLILSESSKYGKQLDDQTIIITKCK
ncbi:MAG: serine/threonine-protein phosphatase [Ignavibacteriae bacterium]|nr:serine/threonine-protein phosphatase [Ignavibacteriota bacterium]